MRAVLSRRQAIHAGAVLGVWATMAQGDTPQPPRGTTPQAPRGDTPQPPRGDAPPPPAPRGDGAPPELLRRIADARAAVRTLAGPFTQTRTLGLLATEVVSTGQMALVRPDRLRWALGPPDDVTFWVGPEGLAYRSAHGRGKVSSAGARIGAALEDLRTLLGGDLQKLRVRWSLRLLRDDASGVELEATPRAPAPGGLRSMRFALAADLVRPTRTILVEGERDQTTLVFGDLLVNAPIDEASMRGD